MRFWITVALLAVLLLAALWRGGKPERIVAALLNGAFLLELGRNLAVGQPTFRTLDPFMLLVDAAVLAGMLAVALQANRLWPMAVAGLQLVILTGHASLLLQLKGLAGAYWGMAVLPIYPQCLLVLAGIAAHARRRARVGPYPDWRRPLARG